MLALQSFVENLTRVIIQPVILLLFALAMFYFVNGVGSFIMKSDNPEERKKGRSKLLWGIAGFFIMSSVTAILYIVTYTFCGTPWCNSDGYPGIQQGKF